MLTLNEYFEQLNENWGPLQSKLPKKVLAVLSKMKMSTIGQNSEIKTIPFTGKWEKFRTIVADSSNILTVAKNKKTDEFVMFYSGVPRVYDGGSWTGRKGTNKKIFIQASTYKFTRTYSDKSAKQDFENFVGTIEDEKEWEIITVGRDAERIAKQAQREADKFGVVPLPSDSGYKKYMAELKSELKDKAIDSLNAKIAKADIIKTIGDFKKAAESAVPKKMNFRGMVMELRDIGIRGKSADDSWSVDSIDYRLAGSSSMFEKMRDIMEKEGLSRDEAYEVAGNLPEEVKFIIEMKGLKLEIARMEIKLWGGKKIIQK